MTLDLAKFISNSIKTQAKIQHLDVFTKTTDQKSIPESVSSLISKQYGEKYLLDSDFVAFFWGHLDKKQIEKLFNVVDKALGKSANKLTETDFKKLKLDNDASANIEDEQTDVSPDEEELDQDEYDSVNEEPEEIDSDETNEELDDDSEEDDSDDDSDDDSEEDDSKEDDSKEDDSDKELDEDENEDVASLPTTHFFLKITLK